MHTLSRLALVTLAACGAAVPLEPGFEPRLPAPPHYGTLVVPEARLAGVKALQASVDRAIANHDCAAVAGAFPGSHAATVLEWCGKLLDAALSPVTLRVEPLYPAGRGVVATVEIRTDHVRGGGFGAYAPKDPAYVGPDDGGITRVYLAKPWPVPEPMLVGEQATVWIAPAAEWIVADTLSTVEPHGADTLVFELAVRELDDPGRFRIVEVSADGVALPFRLLKRKLVVQLAHPGDRARVRIRYEGEAPQNSGDWIVSDDVVLRGTDGHWLPRLAETWAAYEVSVRVPAGFRVFGQGHQSAPVAIHGGWEQTEFRFQGDSFTLYGGASFVTRTVSRAGVEVLIAARPENQASLEPVAALVATALAGLAPLGAYPFPQLRIVDTGFPGGYGAVSNITLGSGSIANAKLQYLAHELAHGWFGGLIPPAPRGGQWQETLAEYASSWALPADEAHDLRRQWIAAYSGVPEAEDRPVFDSAWGVGGYEAHYGVTYAKGALILSVLEDRVGRPLMQQALARFIAARATRFSTWDDIVAAIDATCNADDAAWFRRTLTSAGAPRFELVDVKLVAGRLSGKLVVEGPPYAGTVEVGFTDGKALVGVQAIDVTQAQTALALTVPQGTARVVVDPRFRLVRRVDPRDEHAFDGVTLTSP